MSNKAKTTTAKPDGKPALTPKQRFPEFRDAGGWKAESMGEVYSFKGNNSLSRDQLNYEHGSVKNIHYGDIHTKFSAHFDITKETVPFINPSESLDGFRADNDCVEGDMIFADASEDLADIGKSIEIVRLSGERVVSGQHTILARPNDDSLAIGFGAYLFKSSYVRTQIQKESQGSKVLGISATRLTKIKLPIPSTKPEQQKIAECLSSVDELITAQARKLDALKTHKKGLMQQLFPREGETQPRLRFPEFQNAGEWVESQLNGLSSVGLSNGVFNDPKKVGTGYKLINVLDMYIETTIIEERLSLLDLSVSEFEKNQVKHGDIFFTRSSLVKSGIAVSNIYLGSSSDVTFDGHLIRFRGDTNKVVPLFAHYLFKTEPIRAQLIARGKSATMTTIGQVDVGGVMLLYPKKEEQQRIADCLTSLDDLIAAQTQKLDALKTHKKGLMQQLFPNQAEV